MTNDDSNSVKMTMTRAQALNSAGQGTPLQQRRAGLARRDREDTQHAVLGAHRLSLPWLTHRQPLAPMWETEGGGRRGRGLAWLRLTKSSMASPRRVTTTSRSMAPLDDLTKQAAIHRRTWRTACSKESGGAGDGRQQGSSWQRQGVNHGNSKA